MDDWYFPHVFSHFIRIFKGHRGMSYYLKTVKHHLPQLLEKYFHGCLDFIVKNWLIQTIFCYFENTGFLRIQIFPIKSIFLKMHGVIEISLESKNGGKSAIRDSFYKTTKECLQCHS